MAVHRVYREAWLPGSDLIVVAVGCPDDGREYVEIEADTPVKGCRVVWYSSETHGHRWGYIVSDWPRIGEHIDRSWSLEDRARYWLEVVPDEEMPDYLRAEGRAAQLESMILIPAERAWLTPVEPIPSQRTSGNA